jgi:RNA polymerase sigma-70 factor (ECF subfamily)
VTAGEDDRSGHLVERWRSGDQQAAAQLFHRYADRLIALARSRLPARLAGRVDAEDVVQSVYRCFFAEARAGRYELQRGGDLWHLLVTITLHKVLNQIGRNSADKRACEREQRLDSPDGPVNEVLAREPSPVEALALADEVEQLMGRLTRLQRQVLELRLAGHNQAEIAAATQRTERTVRRLLDQVKDQLRQRYDDTLAQ